MADDEEEEELDLRREHFVWVARGQHWTARQRLLQEEYGSPRRRTSRVFVDWLLNVHVSRPGFTAAGGEARLV